MWSTLVGKEFVSRLQGRLSYGALTLLVALFTGLALATFWLVVVTVPTIVPVIGSNVGLVLAVVSASLAFVSAVGLLFSALARTSTLAALYTYVVVYGLAIGSLMAYLLGASMQNEAMVRPFLSLNPFVALATIPDGITSSLQQTLPFQYRAAFDPVSYDWPGLSLRYPRWLNTLLAYLTGTIVL